jgi:hypothetical protein
MTIIRKQILEEVKKLREAEQAGVAPPPANNDGYEDEPAMKE